MTLFKHRASPEHEKTPRSRAQWNLMPIDGVSRIIAIASGKGGVGKSTVAVGLAVALARRGMRIGLLDADIYGPSIPRMMGLSGKPAFEDGQLVPLQAHGVQCMSLGFLIGEEAAVMRGPMISKTLNQLLRGTRWGIGVTSPLRGEVESQSDSGGGDAPDPRSLTPAPSPLDALLIDLPPGTGDVQLSLMQQVPLAHNGGGMLLVTTPQEVALDDARKALKMCEKIRIPILGVIENMSHFTDPAGRTHRLFGEGGGAALAQEANAPLFGKIALDPELRERLDRGDPPVMEAFEQVASALFG